MAIGKRKRLVHAAAIVLAMSPVTAVTQSAPMMETVPVSFTGIAMDWFADSIRIIQPDGSLAEYRGPLPDLAVRPGDTVNFTYNVRKPAGASFAASSYDGQVAVDGNYKISVNQALAGGAGNSWAVSGGGGKSGRGGVPGQDDAKLSASYQVGFNAQTGKTQVLAGSPPAGGAEKVSNDFARAPAPAIKEEAAFTPKPAGNPVALTAQENAAEHRPAGGSPAVELPFEVKSTSPSISQTPAMTEPGREPVPVPAPGALLIFAMAAAALPLRRKLSRV